MPAPPLGSQTFESEWQTKRCLQQLKRAVEDTTTATESNGSNRSLMSLLSAGHSFVYTKNEEGSSVKCGGEDSFFTLVVL